MPLPGCSLNAGSFFFWREAFRHRVFPDQTGAGTDRLCVAAAFLTGASAAAGAAALCNLVACSSARQQLCAVAASSPAAAGCVWLHPPAATCDVAAPFPRRQQRAAAVPPSGGAAKSTGRCFYAVNYFISFGSCALNTGPGYGPEACKAPWFRACRPAFRGCSCKLKKRNLICPAVPGCP